PLDHSPTPWTTPRPRPSLLQKAHPFSPFGRRWPDGPDEGSAPSGALQQHAFAPDPSPRALSREQSSGNRYSAFVLCPRPRGCGSSSVSCESFLAISVSSATRFDRVSISLRLGTFRVCSARATRSSNTCSSLSQAPVALSFASPRRSSAAVFVRSWTFSPSATSVSY